MTDDQIKKRIAVWQKRLGLDSWSIAVEYKPEVSIDNLRVFCRCARHQFYDRATLVFDEAVRSKECPLPDSIERDMITSGVATWDEFIDQTIGHEMIHCALRDLMEAGDIVREHISPAVADVWDKTWRRAEEACAERMSIALTRSFDDLQVKKGK